MVPVAEVARLAGLGHLQDQVLAMHRQVMVVVG